MALTTKRIITLPSQTEPQEGDYLVIDNKQGGTHKIPAGSVGVEVDDTLTEQGKAADAKATGDALDEIRSQAEATDDAIGEIRSQIEVTGTASGAIATFTDGSDNPMKSCMVTIVPKQSGTGTPSPDNVRTISGWESVSLHKSGVNVWDEESELGQLKLADGTPSSSTDRMRTKNFISCLPSTNYYICNTTTYTSYFYVFFYDTTQTLISYDAIRGDRVFQTPQNCNYVKFFLDDAWGGQTYTGGIGINYPSTDTEYHAYNGTNTTVNLGRTVYGGTLDVVSGVLTSYPFYPSYNGETLNGRWICDREVYAEGTTPPTGSQVALISGTGTTYQLTPTEVKTLLGENNVWADSGDVEVVYVRDLNIAINNLLNSNGTRSLGMMAMSAPTKDTAEEPTDEQTEEPAEDDMR